MQDCATGVMREGIIKTTTFLVLPVICFTSSLAYSQAKPDYYLLIAMNSYKCAHVQAASQDNSGTISQWQCRDQKQLDVPQYFQWQKINVGGGYFLLQAMHSHKCAQVNGASKENGAAITQWDCQRDRPHFHWKLEVAEDKAGDRYYYIVNRASGKCMHVQGVQRTTAQSLPSGNA
jgi:hypothetical protein